MSGKREKYIDFDTYFMSLALVASSSSKDPRTQVEVVWFNDYDKLCDCFFDLNDKILMLEDSDRKHYVKSLDDNR